MVSKGQQIRFYDDELRAYELDTKVTFESSAMSLMSNEELFRGAYQGFDAKRGNIFIDFRKDRPKPRLDQSFLAFKVSPANDSRERFAQLRYRDLLKEARQETDSSELRLVNYMKADNPAFVRAICRDVSIVFQQSLKSEEIICVGPGMPPFEYLQNLLALSEQLPDDRPIRSWEKLLLQKLPLSTNRMPEFVTEEQDIPQVILDAVHSHRIVVVQGPPGTGKTHQIADLISRIIGNNESVLLTAQTNRSVVEVCAKPSLMEPLKQGLIRKTSLSGSEKASYPHLEPIKEITAIKGCAILTTYYQFSRTWLQQDEPSFDYVIVEEASQAFLTTLAGALKMGHYVIAVGDPYQLFPIVRNRTYRDVSPELDRIVYGLQTLSEISAIPFYRKTETRRLMPRATEYTNLFYQNTVQSLSLVADLSEDALRLGSSWSAIIPEMGGPVWCSYHGSASPKQVPDTALRFLENFLTALFEKISKVEIAILTPFTKTLSDLQGPLRVKFPSARLIIETVDRVQGLDVDYCFIVLPTDSYTHSLEWHRFNVATSRARKATFLIAHEGAGELASADARVMTYLTKLKTDFFCPI